MFRVRRLKINRYRRVKPGCELHFDDGMNVLLGKNGTGKTTLLDLLSMILRFDFQAVAKEPFDIEFDVEGIERTTEREGDEPPVMPEWTLNAVVKTSHHQPESQAAAPPRWICEARVTLRIEDTEYSVIQQGAVLIKTKDGTELSRGPSNEHYIDNSLLGAMFDKDRDRTTTWSVWRASQLEWWGFSRRAWRFDESLERFQNMVGNEPQVVLLIRETTGDEKTDVDGMSILVEVGRSAPHELIMETIAAFREHPDAQTCTFTDRDLRFLQRAVESFGFASAQLTVSVQQSHPAPDGNYYNLGDLRFRFTIDDRRTIISHDQLSYGQKRMLALFYYLEANPRHIIADELVNGLHHEWIKALIDELRQRQAFLSSQNPILLDYMEFESAEDVKNAFVLCQLDDQRQMTWRNLTPEEARSFYSAYEVGIQQVGEILLTKGLW